MGEAARLPCLLCLSPVDNRNILTAVCHHPVIVERWILERQPCQPLKHFTVNLGEDRDDVLVQRQMILSLLLFLLMP